MWPGEEGLRRSVLRAEPIALSDISGRILFPTVVRGPWPPFERFVEVSMSFLATSDPHTHASEEALTYVLEGRVSHRDASGRETVLEPGSTLLFGAGRETGHDLSMKEGPRARWLAVVVRSREGTAHTEPLVQIAHASPPAPGPTGVRRTTVVGPGAPVRSATGLECVDLRFEREAEEVVSVGDRRRAIAYVLDGAAVLDGKPARDGEAAARDNATEIPVRGAAGARVWVAAVPHSA